MNDQPLHPCYRRVLCLVRLCIHILWAISVAASIDWLAKEPRSHEALLELVAALASILTSLTDSNKMQGGSP